MNEGPEPPADAQAAPPGWYQDHQGTTRWWDGVRWVQPGPPAPSDATPGVAPPGVGTSALDPGAAFSYGWKKFQEYWAEFLSIVLVVALVNLGVVLLTFIALLPLLSDSSAGRAIGIVAFAIALLVAIAVTFVVQAGVVRAGLGVTRGVRPSLDMLVAREHLGTYVGTVLIVSLAVTIGVVLCILPGLVVAFFCAYAPLIALDKGLGPVDSIRRSIDLVKDNFGQVALVLVLAYAVYYVGSLACYVGLLVSIPVALVMVTYSYRILEREPIAP